MDISWPKSEPVTLQDHGECNLPFYNGIVEAQTSSRPHPEWKKCSNILVCSFSHSLCKSLWFEKMNIFSTYFRILVMG